MNSHNKLEKIYQDLGNNICLFPFFAVFYKTFNINDQAGKNIIKPCSLFERINSEWEIDDNSIIKTVNNTNWKNLRKNFIERSCHDQPECINCSNAERSGGNSARQLNNQYFAEHLSIDIVEEVNKIIENDYEVIKILNLDFYPSNYCNYSCIMCKGGASTSRWTFERSTGIIEDIRLKIISNTVDQDFNNLLESVEIINFTGGETLLQSQVHDLIDYLIDKDLSKNIIITLLTNASKYPIKLKEKFKKFKNVFYTLSIDGVGEVLEYQRRGAEWSVVEPTALELWNTMGSVINHVVTAVNVFGFLEFVNWLEKNSINNKVFLSLVFNKPYLSVNAIPDTIKLPLINKLKQANYSDAFHQHLIDQMLDILKRNVHQPDLTDQFVQAIKLEDTDSKKKLVDVVPDWKPYFE